MIELTENLELIMPDSDEIARHWASPNGPGEISKFNNDKISEFLGSSLMNQGMFPVQTYVPTFTASTANPTLGSGSTLLQQGNYVVLPNNLIIGSFNIRYGNTGINVGSGSYRFGLPFPVDFDFYPTTIGDISWPMGCGVIRDNSTVANHQTSVLGTVATVPQSVTMWIEFTNTSSALLTHQVPFTVAASDGYCGNFVYKGVVDGS